MVGLLACAACAGKAPVDDTFEDLATVDSKSDYFSYRLKLLGTIADGGSVDVAYTKSPRFRGVTLTANAGDQVDVWVRSTDGGDAVAWLLDDRFHVIAKNDDADGTTSDSHVRATLTASASHTYYIVLRDYDLKKHAFTVQYDDLSTTATPAAPDSGNTAIARAFQRLLTTAGGAFATESHVVAEATLPTGAQAGASEFHGAAPAGVSVVTWRFTVGGAAAYAVMMESDGTFYASLYDATGTWVSHGRGTDIHHDTTLAWGLDIDDPTICRCGLAPDNSGYAGCEWVDGARYASDISDCD